MQIQSPSFMYQTPQFYGVPQSQVTLPQSSMLTQSPFYPQGQSDQAMNLLSNILFRVLDFAFNLISQLSGQRTEMSFKSALAPTDNTGVMNSTNVPPGTSIWNMGSTLVDTLDSSLGVTKLASNFMDGAKNIFSGGVLSSATKVGGMLAGIF